MKRLRYGENPQQEAFLNPSALQFDFVQGKELSYNNIVDADLAYTCAMSFVEPTCVIVKHANPCGIGTASDSLIAYHSAFRADPTSAFGGIIAFNCEVDWAIVNTIINENKQFIEVLIAPSFTHEAIALLTLKPNIRVLRIPNQPLNAASSKTTIFGALIQDNLDMTVDPEFTVTTNRAPTEEEIKALKFAWRAVAFVKSNAIVVANALSTLGIGAGQMSRIKATEIAVEKAYENDFKLLLPQSVMASDAFFPFSDCIEVAHECGIKAIVHPGGSVNDQLTIDYANEHDMAVVTTGMRVFRH